MAHNLSSTLAVAGIGVRLDLGATTAQRRAVLASRYGEFLQADVSTVALAAVLAIHDAEGDDFLPWSENAPLPVRVRLAGERLWVRSPWESGWLDMTHGIGAVTLRPQGDFENFLRVLFAWLCLQRGGLLLHACGLQRAANGYLFAGPSGAGKSTVASLATGATVLSDDLVIVRPVRGRFHVFATPFHGSAAPDRRNTGSAPLAGIYFLVQAPHHALLPLNMAESLARMVAATPFVTSLPAGAALTLGACTRLVSHVPPQALEFRPDPGFWEVIHG